MLRVGSNGWWLKRAISRSSFSTPMSFVKKAHIFQSAVKLNYKDGFVRSVLILNLAKHVDEIIKDYK